MNKYLYGFDKMTNAKLVDAAKFYEREFITEYVPGLFAHELVAALRCRLEVALDMAAGLERELDQHRG